VTGRAREVRFVAIVEDLDEAERIFGDALGLEVQARFEGGGGRGLLLDVPAATLELFEQSYADHVDGIEVGRALGAPLRIAVRVEALDEGAAAVADAGANTEADPVLTPWGDHNQRFRAGGIQLTLFESPS
jgi:catechol 2,3-dioxygenase-like lactoylglutathione lyase family enzyme